MRLGAIEEFRAERDDTECISLETATFEFCYKGEMGQWPKGCRQVTREGMSHFSEK